MNSDPEDLTGRARIREAALRRFGEHGFDGTTIRGIAEAAGVAPSLVRHHFGSKQGLRDACDDHLIRTIRRLNTRVEDAGPAAAADLRPVTIFGPYQRYLARALSEGAAAGLFDEIVAMNERWLTTADPARTDPPLADRRARATVRTAMSLAVAVLFEHVSRNLDQDPTAAAGEARLMRAVLDVQAHPTLTPEQAAAASAAIPEGR